MTAMTNIVSARVRDDRPTLLRPDARCVFLASDLLISAPYPRRIFTAVGTTPHEAIKVEVEAP